MRISRYQPFLIAGTTILFLAAIQIENPAAAQDSVQPTEKTEKTSDDTEADQQDASTDDASTDEASTQDPVDEILAGHSYHGEAFNEGPRQKAYLMGGTGNVAFPVTTSSKRAQAFINQGVGQLHGFWDLEAERSFRQAAMLDENCAMAYWGAALAANAKRDRARGFIEKAVEIKAALKDKISRREQLYIDALAAYLKETKSEKEGKRVPSDTKKKLAQAYLKALESIVLEFPEDLEAKAFVAHRIWNNGRDGIPVSSYIATDSLLQDIFAIEPLHPSHHYTIHLWDYRKPERAVQAAARCGPAAPSIAHMWHMPGHIYSRLKRYEDAVFQQEASARVDHAHMMRDRVMPDEIHNFAHNNEWLIRNLVYVGRVDDAVALAKNMIELPQHPRYNTLENSRGSAAFGRRRLLKVLREYELHEQAIQLCQSVYLDVPENGEERVKTMRLLGCSSAATQNTKLTEAITGKLERLLKGRNKVIERNQKEIDGFEAQLAKNKATKSQPTKSQPTEDELKKNASTDSETVDTEVAAVVKVNDEVADEEIDVEYVTALLKESKSQLSKAKRLKKQIEKALLAIEGYQLVADGKFETAYEKLKKATGEDNSWLGEIQFLSGDEKDGLDIVKKQVDRRKQEVIPLARWVYLLHRAGKIDEAKTAFEKLRDTSSSIDLHVPMFARLEPIAKEFGFAKDWRKPLVRTADIGFRPTLDSLGPFRWSPSPAPKWSAIDDRGQPTGDNDYAGRPHVVIFYLGHGCLHCAEQLQAFAPRVKDFNEVGIDVIAISIDSLEGLKKSIESYGSELPIRLASDDDLDVFKSFRAYDDFEKQPLHGTFLIDAKGMVRWQDISYEPFMEPQFLIDESQRLLNQKQVGARVTSKTDQPVQDDAKPADTLADGQD